MEHHTAWYAGTHRTEHVPRVQGRRRRRDGRARSRVPLARAHGRAAGLARRDGRVAAAARRW